MKRLIYTFVLILATSFWAQAQVYFEENEQEEIPFKDRLYFGGNFSFNIGNRSSFIDVSPLAGYMVNEDFSVGLGATYLYLSREFTILPSGDHFKVKNSVYGGRTFARHTVFESFFAHAEFESLNVEFPANDFSQRTVREWVPGLFIGGGSFQNVFGRGGINLTVLYNLLHDNIRSPYNSAWVIRGGITF